jgi:two-component system chemotaxis response regulator CheY
VKTCLIVDDSMASRGITRKIVAALGFIVSEAANGEQALASCEAKLPDAIVLDLNMPVMNGLDFLKALVEQAGKLTPPVIICSGESGIQYIQDTLAAGACEYVIKPFDRDIIAAKFRDAGLIA